MFTEGDAPFRFLANVKPYVAVHGTGTLEQDYADIGKFQCVFHTYNHSL